MFRRFALIAADVPDVKRLHGGNDYWWLLPSGSYVYLGTPNLNTGKLVMSQDTVTMAITEDVSTYYTAGADNIYSNGGAKVFIVP